MVFMNGNNDLESSMEASDLTPMETVGSTSAVNIVVLFARRSTNDARVYYVERGSLTTEADWGQTDMGSPQSLQRFIAYVATNYPAQHYALVVYNHGGGFQGISQDFIHGYDLISMSGLKTALSISAVHFSVIGLDACLMAMIEVAYQIRQYGDYVVGSEEESYVGAWNYQTVLTDLVTNPQMSGRQLAIDMVQAYSQISPGWTDDAAIDLSRMTNVGSSVSNLANALINDLPKYKTQIRTDRNNTDSSDYYTSYADLYDFASGMSPLLDLTGKQVRAHLDKNEYWEKVATSFAHLSMHLKAKKPRLIPDLSLCVSLNSL
jgi:hypothetical protein